MNPQYTDTLPPAPTKIKSQRFPAKLIVLAIGLIIVLAIGGGLMVLSKSNNPITQMQRLSVRLDTLQALLKEGTKNVRNPDLKKVQTDASILVAGDAASIGQAIEVAGVKKIPKDITALEADATTFATLADAKFNGHFDDAYIKALSLKLESTMALMREVQAKTGNAQLKAALSLAYGHHSGILDQLSKL